MSGSPLNPGPVRNPQAAPPLSPAGGNGPGQSRPYVRHQPEAESWWWGALHSAEHYVEAAYDEGAHAIHAVEDTAVRIAHVGEAIYLATDYANEAIEKKLRMDVEQLKAAFIPGLLLSLEIIGVTTVAGAFVGGAIAGLFTAGAGLVPGAVAGGELGFDAGLAILDVLGLKMLLEDVFAALPRIFRMVEASARIAWNAGTDPRVPAPADVERAARRLAEAGAEMVHVVVEGVLIWILSKSLAARTGKIVRGGANLADPAALAARGEQLIRELRAKPAETAAALREGAAELAGILRQAKGFAGGLADFVEQKFEQILRSVTEDAEKKAKSLEEGTGTSNTTAPTQGSSSSTASGDAASNAGKPKSLREQYMGRTPGKQSRTGQQVQARMRENGTLRDGPDGPIFKGSDGEWYPLEDADMAHNTDAVKWWNETGRQYGAKSPQVRQWMLDPNNYTLDYYGLNRSAGASLPDRYLPPVSP